MKRTILLILLLVQKVCLSQINIESHTALTCNNWLKLPSEPSYVSIGDLDVPGNKITVEAIVNRTSFLSSGISTDGDIVSKHTGPPDANYILRPTRALVTTTTGLHFTPDVCPIDLNKTYHFAMTYDGATLKFYRNGFLMSQVACTGNMVQNDLLTHIGYISNHALNENLVGYINEVRIWNVARTQAEIRTYMNSSLPNPTTQTGLLAYYTFDDLTNKQGNSAWNGTLGGTASINSTIPNCSFVADSCAVSCNNWLKTQAVGECVKVGDLDVSGTQITVEGNFNCTSFPVVPGNIWEEIVSKHSTPADVNYALRMNMAAVTTTNGFFATPASCDDISLNKTYHVAMVYNGSSLKFYRDGFLMSQIAATGNLILNNWLTTIGDYAYANPLGTNFFGYINEVRIWNVARTQAQLRTYMNTPLPNPTTQPGLMAYYTFDNLLNKQGNATWNGTLGGAASINQGNPNCSFTADSCHVPATIGGVINDYTPVVALNPCENKITVENALAFNAGDTVLMIQMKGAVIDSSNTSAFGSVIDYKNAGNYEFNFVKSKSGNIIELKNNITRQYEIPAGTVQLIRVPYYSSISVASTLSCLPWDGKKGGVLAFNVKDTLTLNTDINVSGKGFAGGNGIHANQVAMNCNENQFYYPVNPDLAAQKGEGIATISDAKSYGKGKYANGGGGGNSHNSGGGGGGNIGNGGFGGYQFEGTPCNTTVPFNNRGIGGSSLNYSNILNRVYMGGGGGAGHANNPELFFPKGGDGGGICIISARIVNGNNNSIISNGGDAAACSGLGATGCHEAMGGGGGGGAILLDVTSYISNITAKIKGGKGGDMAVGGNFRLGPGGGGGGGVCWLNTSPLPANFTVDASGGVNGVCTQYANDPWGASTGQNGATLFVLKIPVDTGAFKKNIDSVRMKDSATTCSNFDFKGFGYTNGNAISQWQWYFGDGGTANTQNTSHTYTTAGAFTVKLVVTDINGCKDSTARPVFVSTAPNFDFNYKQDACNPLSVQFFNVGTNPLNPYWNFGDGGISSGLNPVHVFPAFGNYTVKYSIQSGICIDTVTKVITLAITPANIITTQDTTICFGSTKQLHTVPSLSFCWAPTTYLNDPLSANPITSATQNITYYFTAEVPGTNTIMNGDFNGGNVGFTSQYQYASANVTEGQYFVGSNPQAWNGAMSNCQDHTSGTGNMLLVNGSSTTDIIVWNETVTITPNTNYAFSTWIQSLSVANPAQLQFSINGRPVGTLITASLPTCTWSQFYTTWNSGNNTTANISIINKNTQVQGNDFALDDISFAPVFIKRDSVIITVESPSIKTNNDTTICSGSQLQINTTGASTYAWTPATGLSNPNIANPLATINNSMNYVVTGTTTNGCTAKDTLVISTFTKPVITTSNDSTICKNASVQLFATGGISYLWSPASTLSNANIFNPLATPSATTTYIVTISDSHTCTYQDSVLITVKPSPVFSVSPSQNICANDSKQLLASGGDLYLWQPANFLDNPNISNPVAMPDTSITYSVKIKDNTCKDSATLTTRITVFALPTVTATKSNDIDCSSNFSQLNASGATQFLWTPATNLSNSSIANPIAGPQITTQYVVKGTDANGCSNKDSITITVGTTGKGLYLMPNAFTPNGDNINDCYGLKYWGTVTELDFSIYNRFGQRVFHTTDPSKCWDGTFQGKVQDVNVFVYMIRAKTLCDSVERKGYFLLLK